MQTLIPMDDFGVFVDVCRLLKIEESEILRTIEISNVTKHQIVPLFKELRHETAVSFPMK